MGGRCHLIACRKAALIGLRILLQLEVGMTFLVKMLKQLWGRSQEIYRTGREFPVFQAVSLPSHMAPGTAHVARDHVPLHHRLQIKFTDHSRMDGMRYSKVQFIWRSKWDSSPQLSPNRSAC